MNRKFLANCLYTLESCRELYNAALYQRREAYRVSGKTLTWIDQNRELTAARETPELSELRTVLRSFQTLTLKKLDYAFRGFFRRVGGRIAKAGFPRFQGVGRFDSFTTADSREFKLSGDKLTVSKLGTARLRLSRPLGGSPTQLTIKREYDGWYAVFTCAVDPRPLPASGSIVGVDVGLEAFITLSTGERIENPRYFREGEERLARAQRLLARKVKGSRSRERAKHLVTACHAKVMRRRAWFHWQQARLLTARFDSIAVEDLSIKGLARSRLAKSIQDAGWASFIDKLLVKAEEAGRKVIKVSARFSSQECADCGARKAKGLSDRQHHCECGADYSRDQNAALVILGRAFPVRALPELTPAKAIRFCGGS